MAVFQLASDNAILGAQLVVEVLNASGVDIGDRYGFVPPRSLLVGGELTPEQAAAIAAAVAAHVPGPPPPPTVSRLEFSLLFTAAERIAIRASTDPIVADFQELLAMADSVRLGSPTTFAGVNYLETLALIGAGRAAQILAGDAPTG